MINSKTMIISAIAAAAAAAAVAASSAAFGGPAEAPKFESEKCYGIALAGKNDCETVSHSCAGTTNRDAQADSWIYVPAGTCAKIVGASMKPKA